jgi:hypothetical protein
LPANEPIGSNGDDLVADQQASAIGRDAMIDAGEEDSPLDVRGTTPMPDIGDAAACSSRMGRSRENSCDGLGGENGS